MFGDWSYSERGVKLFDSSKHFPYFAKIAQIVRPVLLYILQSVKLKYK